MIPQDLNKVGSVQAIRTTIPRRIGFFIACIIFLVTIVTHVSNKKEDGTQEAQPIRIACHAGVKNSVFVRTPGKNGLSRKVRIPPMCDARVYSDGEIYMVTYPDGKKHLSGKKIVRAHKSNPEAVAFGSIEPEDVTVIFFRFGTLPRNVL